MTSHSPPPPPPHPPQAHECTHLVNPFHLLRMRKQTRKIKVLTEFRKRVSGKGKTQTRPHCLRFSIISHYISKLLSKLLLCYNIKEALPLYSAISSNTRKITTFNLIPLHVNPFSIGDSTNHEVNNPG